ncbi:phage portal protein [Latilactobacillus curvatus]|uniref:phage portal protein n=1 Tax=Latilactobacillus curvatus TaxID=28038 RepID=UPI0028B36423|nr:phage portal protein [Latilactobacillus curvatus]MDT7016355.1 phage portal protein [Latilactobacillus curvatus]
MGIRSTISNALLKAAEKRGWFDNGASNSIRWSNRLVTDDNILESSDVYELLSDISNQAALAEPVLIGPDGKEIKNHPKLKLLRRPNDYLTGSEFAKLQANVYLLQGDVYPIYIGNQLHLATNVYTELDDRLTEHFKIGGIDVPGIAIQHIKNIGTSYDQGVGLLELGKNTLDGVMNAEKILNEKYKKGGLLAFLLKLDTVLSPSNKNQKAIVKKITEQLDGVSTDGETKMIPLGKGYEIETLKSPVEDDKMLDYLNIYKPDLGKFLGINVDTYQKLMSTDIEKAMMYLHNKVVKPYLKNLSEHYTELLFDADSNYRIEWRINILDFVPYSVKTTIAYNQVRTGLMTPDDGSLLLGQQPKNTDESGQLLISKDLIPLDMLRDFAEQSLKGGEEDEAKGNEDVPNHTIQ